jgi:minor extracellular serine protease Vpr
VRKRLGFLGTGIKVAVIDTGVYYLHPVFGGCTGLGQGAGCRVKYGYDFVGDNYDGFNVPVPDSDPMDNCSEDSHGTHVAGIVAGDASSITAAGFAPQFPWTGVAPDATIGAYRIFGCSGFVGSDVIAAAIYKAHEDGSDIINLSIGGGPAYADSTVDSIAVARVSAQGAIVVSSNGNDGDAGTFSSSGAPAGSTYGFGVASFDNFEQPSPYASIGAQKYKQYLGINSSFSFPQSFPASSIYVNSKFLTNIFPKILIDIK